MGVYSTGNSYGVPDDLIYSFPVQIYKVIESCVGTTSYENPEVNVAVFDIHV